MKVLICLAVLVPLVVGRVLETWKLDGLEAISSAQLQEILDLKVLTESERDLQLPLKAIKVDDDDVSFYVYNRANTEETQVLLSQAKDISSLSAFDLKLNTIFVIHGWQNDHNSTFNFLIGHDYLDVVDVNVICVDWDGIAFGEYVPAAASVEPVGKLVGEFINNIVESHEYSLDNISLIGHSLGAHISGFAGQEAKGRIFSITGLDPAGPLFSESKPNGRLSEDDAQYVRVIHSDASFLGVNYNVGDVDFWPNGGMTQPGCISDMTGACSHGRSYYYFQESMHSNDFIAKKCDTYDNYSNGLCDNNEKAIMGTANIDTSVRGTFFLNTNSDSPFALGDK